MFPHFDKSADKAGATTCPPNMMGPTSSEWTCWPLAQRHAYLRGYLEAEMFYRGVMSLQWKGKFGPATDRAIAHMDFNWPTPARTLAEEEIAITRFYTDPRNQNILFFPARRCVLMQLAGYPPSAVRQAILKVRKAQMDDPSFPGRMLNQRWPSLEKLETLSVSRELDEEESWIRIQLTASEKGADAALPLLDTFIAAHSVHAQAFFLRGRLLLAKNDASGIKDLERTIDIHPLSLPDAYDLIAGYHHRQHDPEKAEGYSGMALRLRTVMDAADLLDSLDTANPRGQFGTQHLQRHRTSRSGPSDWVARPANAVSSYLVSLCGELHHVHSEVNAPKPPDVGGAAKGGDRPRN